eukprot:TRINITY_DN249_c0_g1_i2.p1 TRINITY_DN249_c0_g1~~TRINITY_DN249_c0_g1_i2.p1  ORF type:complete len:495 (+),score=59.94 TRINITY_DN249_c0_g1_i2:61-1545(+)
MMRLLFAYVVVLMCCLSAAAAECVSCRQKGLSNVRDNVCALVNNNSPFCDGCPRVCAGQCSSFTDVNNCGACGIDCQRPNIVPTCASGVCQGTCVEGFGNCNNDFQDGCEISLYNSVSNCGSCGNSCARPNLSPVCQSGLCSGSCNSGFANCNSNLQDGCEINTNTDATNCGACGTSCARPNLSASCSSGTCGGSCNAGFANCNANLVDGCEINTNTDTANCGACGTSCTRPNLSASCSSGTCGGTCNAGFGNCNANLVDGCEVNLNNNLLNCGSCGHGCAAPNLVPACNAGSCTGTCTTGFGNCNGVFADGCEVNLQTSANNCGVCGRQCSAAQTCSNGQCIAAGSVQGFTGTAGPTFAGYSQCVGVLDRQGVDDLPDSTWANLCKVSGSTRLLLACGATAQTLRWIEVAQNVFITGVQNPSSNLIINANFGLPGNQIFANSGNPSVGTSWWVTGNGCSESSPNLTINNGCTYEVANCFGQNLTGDRYLFVVQ